MDDNGWTIAMLDSYHMDILRRHRENMMDIVTIRAFVSLSVQRPECFL
jgi:hypothetical protein